MHKSGPKNSWTRQQFPNKNQPNLVDYFRACAQSRVGQRRQFIQSCILSFIHSFIDSRPPEKFGLRLPAPNGPLRACRVLMMLAACRPGVARGCFKTRHTVGNGRKTCALPGKPPNQIPRGPMEKRGSMMHGLRRVGGIAFRSIAKARAMACGSNPRRRFKGHAALFWTWPFCSAGVRRGAGGGGVRASGEAGAGFETQEQTFPLRACGGGDRGGRGGRGKQGLHWRSTQQAGSRIRTSFVCLHLPWDLPIWLPVDSRNHDSTHFDDNICQAFCARLTGVSF